MNKGIENLPSCDESHENCAINVLLMEMNVDERMTLYFFNNFTDSLRASFMIFLFNYEILFNTCLYISSDERGSRLHSLKTTHT